MRQAWGTASGALLPQQPPKRSKPCSVPGNPPWQLRAGWGACAAPQCKVRKVAAAPLRRGRRCSGCCSAGAALQAGTAAAASSATLCGRRTRCAAALLACCQASSAGSSRAGQLSRQLKNRPAQPTAQGSLPPQLPLPAACRRGRRMPRHCCRPAPTPPLHQVGRAPLPAPLRLRLAWHRPQQPLHPRAGSAPGQRRQRRCCRPSA